MVGLEGQLFLRLAFGFLELVTFGSVNNIGRGGGVNAISLDGNDEVATVLEEHIGIKGNDTSLIGLGDIGEDDVDHTDQHAVAEGLASIFDDGDDVRALLGHVGEIAAGAVGELDGVDDT